MYYKYYKYLRIQKLAKLPKNTSLFLIVLNIKSASPSMREIWYQLNNPFKCIMLPIFNLKSHKGRYTYVCPYTVFYNYMYLETFLIFYFLKFGDWLVGWTRLVDSSSMCPSSVLQLSLFWPTTVVHLHVDCSFSIFQRPLECQLQNIRNCF